EVRGLRARGGFEVEIAWREGKLIRARIRSTVGGTLRLRTPVPVKVTLRGKPVHLTHRESGMVAFAAEPGRVYTVAAGAI
ncbi:MAG: glycoside hydrolase family 95-like protein, partial [Chthonomonadales bacterium]